MSRLRHSLLNWFDTSVTDDGGNEDPGNEDPGNKGPGSDESDRIDWIRIAPFILMHLACLGVIWVGVSAVAVWTAVALYVIRMFAITGFYHRYFSHRAFKTSRFLQWVFGVIGSASVQRGPLWWAAHHRHHHCHSDTDQDYHSPVTKGFWMSHMGWFLTKRGFRTQWNRIRDWQKYAELKWLDRFDLVIPVLLAVSVFGLGALLERLAPELGTNAWQMLVWGFFISTTVLFHATVTINSLAHRFGSRRFPTRDHSRNNFWLALITFGEGWHNNHHHYPASARQGFRWWELDLTYIALKGMEKVGLVWDLRPPPAKLLRG